MTMRAMVVDGTGYEHLRVERRPIPVPGPGQVQVRITAATLNYRDFLMLHGKSTLGRNPRYVPLSCGAGVVTAIGDGVTRVIVGDRVCPTFFHDWLNGPLKDPQLALGGTVDGVAAEYGCFPQDYVVRIPDTLGDLEAATLPCAALTAWTSMFVVRATKPGDVVLLQGTGGVSIAGLQLAKAAGATVVITSSSDARLARARSLGADFTINYARTPDWGAQARKLTGGRGVDVVLEVAGAETLEQSRAAVRSGGTIAGIGLLAGTPVWTVAAKPPELIRIRVGSRDDFEDMNRAIVQGAVRPVVDRVFPLERLGDALRILKAGGTFGKIGIDVTL
ncbi:MAG: NAD(P)-dependent alcohol dehydrogenase [Gammaproteobacteria bacterium]